PGARWRRELVPILVDDARGENDGRIVARRGEVPERHFSPVSDASAVPSLCARRRVVRGARSRSEDRRPEIVRALAPWRWRRKPILRDASTEARARVLIEKGIEADEDRDEGSSGKERGHAGVNAGVPKEVAWPAASTEDRPDLLANGR